MNVRFHLPENQEKYKERALSILLQAALHQGPAGSPAAEGGRRDGGRKRLTAG